MCMDGISHQISVRNMTFYFLVNRTGGTVGALITCPLEVVKTRLQSSTTRIKLAEAGGGKKGVGVLFALR